MNIYNLQKINKIIKSDRIKNVGFWLFYIFRKRYLVIYFDPVLGCNLRCRSCYFSDPERRSVLKGSFIREELPRIAESIFGRALKLQIGCGAEPTLFKHNPELVRLAKNKGVPYISLTTNANLLNRNEIVDLLEAGLDEFTISLHGVVKETYEYLMANASFDKLLENLKILTDLKSQYPNFKLRLNYTVYEFNINELSSFFDVFSEYQFEVLQLRALRNIGGEICSVADSESFNAKLEKIVGLLRLKCKESGVLFIEPEKINAADDNNVTSDSYCYISPKVFYEHDYDWKNETFDQYAKRKNYGLRMFKKIFF